MGLLEAGGEGRGFVLAQDFPGGDIQPDLIDHALPFDWVGGDAGHIKSPGPISQDACSLVPVHLRDLLDEVSHPVIEDFPAVVDAGGARIAVGDVHLAHLPPKPHAPDAPCVCDCGLCQGAFDFAEPDLLSGPGEAWTGNSARERLLRPPADPGLVLRLAPITGEGGEWKPYLPQAVTVFPSAVRILVVVHVGLVERAVRDGRNKLGVHHAERLTRAFGPQQSFGVHLRRTEGLAPGKVRDKTFRSPSVSGECLVRCLHHAVEHQLDIVWKTAGGVQCPGHFLPLPARFAQGFSTVKLLRVDGKKHLSGHDRLLSDEHPKNIIE